MFDSKDYFQTENNYYLALMVYPQLPDILQLYGLCIWNLYTYINPDNGGSGVYAVSDAWTRPGRITEARNYQNCVSYIFRSALDIDPEDEIARKNLSLSGQLEGKYSAMAKLAQEQQQEQINEGWRQAQAEARRQQEESWTKLLETTVQFANGIAQAQQNQSGGGGYSAGSNSGKSSSQSQGHIARNGYTWAQNNYRRYERAIEQNLRTLERSTDSRQIEELKRSIRDSQDKMRAFREEADRQGVELQKSRLEDRKV